MKKIRSIPCGSSASESEVLNPMNHRPIVGITPGLNAEESYLTIHKGTLDALMACGAVPVLLPLTDDEDVLQAALDALDGVLFSGGGDPDPLLFGEYQRVGCGAISPLRDRMEMALCRLLLARPEKPVLGICRGFQIMNLALGGDIYQDLATDYPGALQHRQKQSENYVSHPVQIVADSPLRCFVQQDTLLVNSLHHQAVRRMGRDFLPCATAPDGVIEAAYLMGHPFFLGVQWHPERLWGWDCASKSLILAFVSACKA